RHGAAGGAAAKEFARGNIRLVPALFGQQPAWTCRAFQGREELPCGLRPSCRELVMGALAGQERPGAAGPGPVEGPAILVLAVPVEIVAIPDRTLRQVDLQQGIDRAHRVEDTWIVGGPQAEAHERQRVGT